MLDAVKKALSNHKIDLVGAIPMSQCNIIRPRKLEGIGFNEDAHLSVIIFAIPYYTEHRDRNISAYAVSRDYHLFAKQLFGAVIPELALQFPQYHFAGFADNSPISEVRAAAMSGLGIIGDNGMLITEKYSSYVFLGEIITDYPISSCNTYEIKTCEHCGVCQRACPMPQIGECLSSLTQKKGELTDCEKKHIKKYGSAWGCDLCQEVCPHTARAIREGTVYTPIEFFTHDNVAHLTSRAVLSMNDEQFSHRAYSWRGRKTIMRNLEIIENDGKGGKA